MRRRRERAAAAAAAAVQAQAPERTSFDIGFDGSVEDFRRAYDDVDAWKELRRGAYKAFHEGDHENIQALMANPAAFGLQGLNNDHQKAHCRNVLFQLIQDKDNAADIITLAIEKIPEQQRHKFLDALLYSAIDCNPYTGEEPFVVALIGAGANANAEVAGAGGRTLAVAITKGHTTGVIKQLCDHGATFAEAEHRIRTRQFWDQGDLREKCIEKLKVYRQEITGERATVEVRPELLLQMQQTIEDLTLRMAALPKSPAPAAVQGKRMVLK
jgi:hypothetical protein